MGFGTNHNWDSLASGIETAFVQDYPEHLRLSGTAFALGPLRSSEVLRHLAFDTYRRFGTFAPTDEQIESLLANVSEFFDRKSFLVQLYSFALNLFGPRSTPRIVFPGRIVLRPTTDEECTKFYGGDPIFGMQRPISFPDFVFVKEIEVPKVIGTYPDNDEPLSFRSYEEELDLCILALATFKEGGAVGYDGVRIASRELALGPGSTARIFTGMSMFR